MPFDASAFSVGLHPPEFRLHSGKVVMGRLLSAFEYQDALEWAKVVEDQKVPRGEREEMARRVLALVFPIDVAAEIVALPAEGFWKAWTYFFTSQHRARSEAVDPPE